MASLSKSMTRADFEKLVEETLEIIVASGLPSPREKVYGDMLARFAELNGVTPEDAEKLLDGPAAEPEPEPEPAPVSKKTLTERTRALREVTSGAKFFYEPEKDRAFMDLFFALRQKAGLIANLLITGPSGAGKTEGVALAAERAGLPCYKVDCASITTPERWVGHKEIDSSGTHFVLSEHLKWVSAQDCQPGVVLYDELNRLHPMLHNILFPLLDGSQRIWVPDLGIHVDVHPETIFVATANIGTGFTGTHRLDDALLGRFLYRMERDFPNAPHEIEILVKRTGIDSAKAKTLVDIAQATRQKVKTGDLERPVSTRNLLATAALVAAGMSIPQAADYTFVTDYGEDGGAGSQRVMVKQIVAGKATGK